MNVLLESCGSLTSRYLIDNIKKAGHTPFASDVNECFATHYSSNFVYYPKYDDKNLWKKIEEILIENKINTVIPTFDKTLKKWSGYKKEDTNIVISNENTIDTCINKLNVYNFFIQNQIPTPKTSKERKYSLIKPISGSGGKGIFLDDLNRDVSMKGMLSQQFIEGKEFTVDVLCDLDGLPIYIVPRQRLTIVNGKAINSVVIEEPEIEKYIKRVCSTMHFVGPINIQCIKSNDNKLYFLEINPRFGGGTALSIQATDNWADLLLNKIIFGKPIERKNIKYGLKMFRYYSEVFT